MTGINRNIVRAAVLQQLGQPYTLIFIDLASRKLYLAVCTSSPNEIINPTFSAVETTSDEIIDYMSDRVSLSDIFLSRKTIGFKIVDDDIYVEPNDTFQPDQTFDAMNWFDSEFCEEEGWIDAFLKRHAEGQQFVVA